jgi:hypothetical protein
MKGVLIAFCLVVVSALATVKLLAARGCYWSLDVHEPSNTTFSGTQPLRII